MRYALFLILLLVTVLFGGIPSFAASNARAIGFRTDAGDFILPFQIVNGTELYCFREGKGFPGAETTLWTKGRYEFTVGAAPVIGTDINVPFAGIQTRLSPAIFETSNNDLLFGLWAGKPSRRLSRTL